MVPSSMFQSTSASICCNSPAASSAFIQPRKSPNATGFLSVVIDVPDEAEGAFCVVVIGLSIFLRPLAQKRTSDPVLAALTRSLSPQGRGEIETPFSRAHVRARLVEQQCQTSVARMSGAICGYGREASMSIPDVALLIRATKTKEIKEAERRQTHCRQSRTQTACGRATERSACAALPLSGALACRRSTTALAKGTYVTQGATQAMLPGTRSERVLPAFACPSPVSTSRAGRNAGRHDAQAARERG